MGHIREAPGPDREVAVGSGPSHVVRVGARGGSLGAGEKTGAAVEVMNECSARPTGGAVREVGQEVLDVRHGDALDDGDVRAHSSDLFARELKEHCR